MGLHRQELLSVLGLGDVITFHQDGRKSHGKSIPFNPSKMAVSSVAASIPTGWEWGTAAHVTAATVSFMNPSG